MADQDRIVEIIQGVPLFRNLKRRQLAGLARDFVERQCAEGEVIVPQGRDGFGFFIIVSGAAKAVRQRADGSEVTVNTLGPSDFFGELALLDNGPRTASVIATVPTHCLILARENFLGTLRRDGEMAVQVLVELAKRFRSALDAS